jgi:Fe-S oxidoreductase
VAEVCHQCRRCLPLCSAFPRLFELVDASDREVEGLTRAAFEEVNELCFHCKSCFNHCPYTAPHAWDVDFPALMRRQQVARARRDGIPRLRRLATGTDRLGRLGSLAPALLNLANRIRPSRFLMEKVLGIHRDGVLPSYRGETFERWFRRRGPRAEGANGRAVLFTTCSVNYSDPDAARAAVEVLERSDVRVDVCYPRCCGMPFTDVGDLDAARRNAERNVADLLPFVEAGAAVVVPGPSCSLMLKTEYPKLVGSPAAARVACATRDLMEFVLELAREKKLDRSFARPLGRVAYHAPCHLRAQKIGLPAVALLERLAGAEVVPIESCSGVDGTWGMQARFHAESMKVAARMLEGIGAAGADFVATDCPLSALRIEEGLGRKAVHPIALLHRAYGLGPE